MAKMNPWYEMFAKGMVDPRQAAALEAQNASQEDPTGTIGNVPVERSPATTTEQDAARAKQMQEHLAAQAAIGKNQQHESELAQGSTVQTVMPAIPGDADLDKLMGMRKKFMAQPQNLKAQAQIDSQEQFLQKYMSAPIGFDFKTAMGGLASFYPESSAANLYKILPAQDTPQARVKTISMLQDSLNNARSKYFTNVEEQMKGALAGSTIRSTAVDNLKNKFGAVPPDTYGERNALSRERLDATLAKNFRDEANAQTMQLKENIQSASVFQSLPIDNPASFEAARGLANKFLVQGKGAVTEDDIQRASPTLVWTDNMKRWWDLGTTGTMDEAQWEEWKSLAKGIQAAQVQKMRDTVTSVVNQHKLLVGKDFSKAGEELLAPHGVYQAPKSDSPTANLAGEMDAFFKAKKAEREAKKAGAPNGKK